MSVHVFAKKAAAASEEGERSLIACATDIGLFTAHPWSLMVFLSDLALFEAGREGFSLFFMRMDVRTAESARRSTAGNKQKSRPFAIECHQPSRTAPTLILSARAQHTPLRPTLKQGSSSSIGASLRLSVRPFVLM